jgi:hypothetical protein
MRYIIAILILMNIGHKCYADYDPTPLPQMIVEADLIIQGKIMRIDSVYYTIIISDQIKGYWNIKTIQINKFEDWECANRLAPYERGQEMIVFLRADTTKNEWKIIGAGNEGELMIRNDSIIYEDIYSDSKSGCNEYDYFDYKICGWEYSLPDFKKAIQLYMQEYPQLRIDYKNDYSIPNKHVDNIAYSRIIYESFSYFIFND